MKKLILLVLVVAAAWYGWKRYPEIVNRQPGHTATVINQTGRDMQRVRLVVDGQTFVSETLRNDAETRFEFKVANDSEFELVWQWVDAAGEFRWRGGRVPRGPMVQQHLFTVQGVNEVIYQARQ